MKIQTNKLRPRFSIWYRIFHTYKEKEIGHLCDYYFMNAMTGIIELRRAAQADIGISWNDA